MAEIVPGVVTVDNKKCPKCGGTLFLKPCPCVWKRKGWQVCARCLNPKCATVVGIQRATKGQPRGRGRRRQAPGPFGLK